MNEIKGQLLPPTYNPKSSNLLTSSSVTPFQVIQLNFLLGFFQLLLYFSQLLLDLLILALKERPRGSNSSQIEAWAGYLTHGSSQIRLAFPAQSAPWCLRSQDCPPSAPSLPRAPPRPKLSKAQSKCLPGPWAWESISLCTLLRLTDYRCEHSEAGPTTPSHPVRPPPPPQTTHLQFLDFPGGPQPLCPLTLQHLAGRVPFETLIGKFCGQVSKLRWRGLKQCHLLGPPILLPTYTLQRAALGQIPAYRGMATLQCNDVLKSMDLGIVLILVCENSWPNTHQLCDWTRQAAYVILSFLCFRGQGITYRSALRMKGNNPHKA